MSTQKEALEYLRRLGLYACERTVFGQPAVFVGAEPVTSDSGMTAFRKGVFIYQLNYWWSVINVCEFLPGSVRPPMSLREACDTAAALLANDVEIFLRVPLESQ